MIEIGFDLAGVRSGDLVTALCTLPDGLKPESFGQEEEGSNREGRVSDQASLDAFLDMAASGFFLFAQQTKYNVITGADGSMRSNRMICQLAGQYAVDLFIGSTLQVDGDGHSSTVTRGRLSGFGGAPNMGHQPGGRRHTSPAWLSMLQTDSPLLTFERVAIFRALAIVLPPTLDDVVRSRLMSLAGRAGA